MKMAVSERCLWFVLCLAATASAVAEAFRTSEREVFEEIEAYFGTAISLEADANLHQEQFDFAMM